MIISSFSPGHCTASLTPKRVNGFLCIEVLLVIRAIRFMSARADHISCASSGLSRANSKDFLEVFIPCTSDVGHCARA
jgi:hypothetical protein